MSLMEFIRELLGLDEDSIELRDWFEKDPHAALAHYGLGHLSAADVHDAMVLVQDNDTVSFDRHYDTGSNWAAVAGEGGSIDWAKAGVHTAGGLWQVREHVTDNHITNNIDDRDTIIDQSVNQQVDTDGGDFDQTIENNSVNATGDGAVAAGDDIEDSTITTGDGNAVGEGNQVVNGDDNTTAFGEGSTAARDLSADNGGAVSVNGDATGDASTNNSHNRDRSEDNDTVEIRDSGNVDIDDSEQFVDDSETNFGSGNEIDLTVG